MSEVRAETSSAMNTAIRVAKSFLLEAFKGERIENLGLEEVKQLFDDTWEVTLGFSRIWDFPEPQPNSFLQMAAAAAAARPQRTYKVVTVSLDGPRGVSIANRQDS